MSTTQRQSAHGPERGSHVKPTAADRTAAAAPIGGSPRLQTHLWRGIKLLLLMNIVPLIGLAWLGYGLARGTIAWRVKPSTEHVMVMAAILAACGLIAVSSWLVLPLARWLRHYPAWHFRHAGRALWFLPMVGGIIAWLALWLVAMAAIATAIVVIVTGAWRLYAGSG